MATEDVITRYILDVKDLQNKVKVIETEMRKASGAAKKAGDDATGAFSGIGKSAQSTFENLGRQIVAAFAIERIIAFGAECIRSFQAAELSAKKLQTAVSVSGGLGKDFDKLIQQSKDLQAISIFSDESIQSAQTAALQFGLTADQVEKLLPLIADFASGTQQSISEATNAVLRGIEGQEKGLKLYGISLQEGATRAENLNNISKQLNNSFKDQAEIVGNTSAGALAKYKNQLDDIQEGIGEKLAPKLQGLRGFFLDIASAANLAADDLIRFFDFITFNSKDTTVDVSQSIDAARERNKKAVDEFKTQFRTLEFTELDKKFDFVGEKRRQLEKEVVLLEGRTTRYHQIDLVLKKKQLDEYTNQETAIRELLAAKDFGIKSDEKSFNIQKATTAQLLEQKKISSQKTDLKSRDLVDAIDAELKAREKAAEELIKLREKQIQAEKDRLIGAFSFMEDLARQETAIRITELNRQGFSGEQLEKEITKVQLDEINQRIQNAKDFNKEYGNLLVEKANLEIKLSKNSEIHPNREDYEKAEAELKEFDKKILAEQEDQQRKIRDIQIEIGETILAGLFELANRQSEILQEQIERDLQIKNDATDAELAKLEERNQRGVLSESQYAAQKKVLEDKKAKDELTARTKINALKHQQDLANQRQALFDIAVATARNAIQQPGLFGALIPFWLALGAAQAAVVLAAPLPKYLFKGTDYLQRGNNKSGRDTIPVMANEGEAIIPTDQNKKYPGLAKAWITDDLDRYFLKTYISPALKEQKQKHDQRIIINNKVDVNDFAKKFARELRQLNYQDRGEKVVIVKNLKQSDTFVDKRNR